VKETGGKQRARIEPSEKVSRRKGGKVQNCLRIIREEVTGPRGEGKSKLLERDFLTINSFRNEKETESRGKEDEKTPLFSGEG